MPTVSPIEKELVSATKTKMKGDRQTALKNLVDAASDLEEEKWEELSPEAQKWVNAGIKASNSEKDIKELPKGDDDESEDDEGDEDTEAEGTDEDEGEGDDETSEDEAEEEPEEDEDTEKDDDMSEDEDEAPKKKKVAAKKAAPKKETKKKVAVKAVPEKKTSVKAKVAEKVGKKAATKNSSGIKAPLDKGGVKYKIKQFMMKKPDIGVEDLQEKLTNSGIEATPMTVQQIRAEFRHSLRFLKMEGHLPDINIS